MSFSRLGLLAVVAVAPIGPGAAQAQPAAASAAASRPAPALGAKILAKLVDLASTGAETRMPGAIAEALGVTTGGQGWTVRQFAVQASATGVVHAVAVDSGPDPVIMLSVRGPAAISIFRVRPDGTLAGGVDYFLETKQTTPLLAAEAATSFASECAFWSTNANSIRPSP